MPKAIHQFVSGYSKGDAISNEARVLRKIFRDWGYDSEIFCDPERILPKLKKECFDVSKYNGTEEDIIFHHLSIGSKTNEVIKTAPGKKVLLYHNITPDHYFRFINQEIAEQLATGRRQMAELAGVAEVNLADSKYNADELVSMGYGKVDVLPLILDLKTLTHTHRKTDTELNDGKVNILFVGRVAPNKAIEDLLHAFYYFQKYVEPNSRLIEVGSASGVEEYMTMMRLKTEELDLKNVWFTGPADQNILNSCLKAADIFLCLSEHEGFGIPLIEAMHQGIPVLGYDCAAVGDTMGGAGVLVKEKNWPLIAETMGRMVKDEALKQAIIAKQNQRITDYKNRDLEAELKQHLLPLL